MARITKLAIIFIFMLINIEAKEISQKDLNLHTYDASSIIGQPATMVEFGGYSTPKCKLALSNDGKLFYLTKVNSTCQKFINSKGKKIICNSNKSVCKTREELSKFVQENNEKKFNLKVTINDPDGYTNVRSSSSVKKSNYEKGQYYDKLAQKHINDFENLKKAEKFYKLACTEGIKKACVLYNEAKEAPKYLNDESYKEAKIKSKSIATAGCKVVYYQLGYGKLGYETEKEEQKNNKVEYKIKGRKIKNIPNTYSKNQCSDCHGKDGNYKALGKSKILQNMTKKEIIGALNGYKNGTYGGSLKGIMAGKAKNLSSKEIEEIANAIGK